ncbi:MAG: amidohydrolase family protein [Nocardioidaceae bacterium]|nr:amidohydrolase family protein [Nocardioidaceae bacterium]
MVTRLRARYVVGYADGDLVLYDDACVVYEGDTVLYVGPFFEGPVDEDHDLGHAIVLPGFVDLNALADNDHAILDHWQGDDRQDGLLWSEDYFAHRHEVFGLDALLTQRRFALAQLLLQGITTAMPIAAESYRAWAETYDEMAGVAEIAGELGLRTYLGPSYRGGVHVAGPGGSRRVAWDPEAGRRSLEEAVAFARDGGAGHGDLVRTALLPARVETLGPELLRATRKAQEELDVPVRFQAAQSLAELRLLRAEHGRHTLRLLDDEGLLEPRTLLAHAWAVNGHSQVGPGDGEDHVGLLAERGVTVVYCPLANQRYAMALESFDGYRERGVNLALGTDTFPPDMVRTMESGSAQARTIARDRGAGQAADLLRAATLGGAAALGRDDLGRLAPGARADITVVSFDDVRTGVFDDPVRGLVNHAHGGGVTRVVVAGRTVVEDGRIPGLDLDALRAEAAAHLASYRRSYSERDHRRRSPDDLFPSSLRRPSQVPDSTVVD